MNKKERLYPIWKKNKNFNRARVARDISLDKSKVYKYIREFEAGWEPKPTKQAESKRIRTLKIQDLIDQERLDHRKILREGIKEISQGDLAHDDTFRRDLEIPLDKWRDISGDEEFGPCKATLPGPGRKIVWGRQKTINDLKRQDGVS